MNKLYLKIPTKDEMWFKKEMEEDATTMDYNAGYNVSFDGYNFQDGTIKEDLVKLQEEWYPKWINAEPSRFYAYIMKEDDNSYIGEVYYKQETENGHEIGILIKGKYRGNGYSTEAIKLLCEKADANGIKKLYHQIPDTRKSAIKADLNNGFKVVNNDIPCHFTKFGERENEILLIREN